MKKVLLVIPAFLPTPLIDGLLGAFFRNFHVPYISIIHKPIANSLAAGVRSSISINIGHSYTSISAIYDFREIAQLRSDRAGSRLLKLLALELYGDLDDNSQKCSHLPIPSQFPSFRACMEILMQAALINRSDSAGDSNVRNEARRNQGVSVPSSTGLDVCISRARLAGLIEDSLLKSRSTAPPVDRVVRPAGEDALEPTEDDPIPEMAYKLLRSLPIDIRAACGHNIVISGGLSRIPGLKKRIMDDLAARVAAGKIPNPTSGAQTQLPRHSGSKLTISGL